MHSFLKCMHICVCLHEFVYLSCVQAPREGIRYSGAVVKGVVSRMTGVPGPELGSSASALTFDSALWPVLFFVRRSHMAQAGL